MYICCFYICKNKTRCVPNVTWAHKKILSHFIGVWKKLFMQAQKSFFFW